MLGQAYNGLGAPQEAKVALKKALKIREQCSADAPYRAAEIYLELAKSHALDDEPETAKKQMTLARELAQKKPCYLANQILQKIEGQY